MEIKLNNIFSKINFNTKYKNHPPLYSVDNTLFFVFDNGVDIDPAFSSFISGALFLEENKLVLKTQPIENPKKYKKEVLYNNISSFTFSFSEKIYPENKHTPPYIQKTKSWEKDKKYTPDLIKINLITQNNEKICFNLFMQNNQPVITYIIN